MDWVDYRLQLMLEAQDNASKIIDDLTKKVEDLKKEVDKNTSSVKQAESQAIGAVKSIKWVLKTLGLTALFATATNEIKKGIDSIVEYQSAIQRLTTLVQNSSWASQGQINTLIAQAEALDKVGVATKESIVAAQSQLATFDMSTKAIETLTPALTDYIIAEKWASASAEDFRSMTNGLAQALNGNYASLTRTWFILDEDTKKIIETGSEMEKVEAIVKVLNSTYEGFNQTVARSTIEGQMIMTQKAFDNLRDSVAEAFIPAVKDTYWELENLYNQATERVENHIDEIQQVISQVQDATSTILWAGMDLLSELWEAANAFFSGVTELINNLWSSFVDFFWQWQDITNEGLTGMAGTWTDFFYFLNQWITAIIGSLRTLYNTASTIAKQFWGDFWDWLKEEIYPTEITSWKKWDPRWYLKDWRKNGTKEVKDAFNESNDQLVNDLLDNFTDRVGQLRAAQTTFKNTTFKELTTSNSNWIGGWSTGGSWSTAKATKEAQDRVKAMNKLIDEQKKSWQQYYKSLDEYANNQLNKQKKVIDDVNKEFQEKFDAIQDKIEDTGNTIKGLNDEISNLKNQLANLKVDENKSIAQEVIRARKELAALEEQYEGLKDTANSVSRNDLQGLWGVGKYDVDLIKKYKDYQDELASMYDWMSASEKQALDKEIEYAQWYDSLNWIQKIKEDYRIRQEEIQAELDSKIASLNTEQELLRQYKKEQKKLQEEWIKKVDEEYKKYQELYDNVKKFEETYMKQLETDHRKQVSMTDRLVEQWNAVYRAKMRAMEAWSADGSRASGGPVYSWQSYLVWENGPEMFVPSTNWRIIKNSDLNNSNPVSVNINISDVTLNNWIDVKLLAEQIEQEITRSVVLNKKGIYSM